MSVERPRVLVIAEAANPRWVSVPLVGWSLASALREVADVHLVTQVRNRDAILQAGWVEGRDFTAIDSEAVTRRLGTLAWKLRGDKGKGWTLMTAAQALSYPYFEWKLWRQFGDRIRGGEFDLVHRVTPLTPTAPSPIARRCAAAGVPFVLGPLNGGVAWPREFDSARRRENEWLSYVRGVYRLLPGYRSTRRHAAAILCGSTATLEQMPAWARDKCVFIPENGIDDARFTSIRSRRAGRPIRVAFLGRLVPYKGADMLLEAAAPLIARGDVRLEIVGEGPETPRLREMVAAQGLEAGVTLHGWLSHEKVGAFLAECDVFAFPSIREFGGGVVFEAMAVGVPPMVVDYGGPGDIVTDTTGWKVPMGPRQAIIDGFRSLLAQLAEDPAAIEPKAAASLQQVRERFTWRAKAEQVREVYRRVLRARPTGAVAAGGHPPQVVQESVL